MIDYIKINISHIDEDILLENPVLKERWRMTHSYMTGELKYPHEAEINGLKFINRGPNYREMRGSIHKYYNLRNERGNQNHDLFSIDKMKWVVSDLNELFSIDPYKASIHNLEYGINLKVNRHPTDIIQENIISYKNSPITRLDKFGRRGYYTQNKKTEYSLKIYDKSRQYRLPEYNILRIEVKTEKIRHIRHTRIKYLIDLTKKEMWIKLANDLHKKIQDLKIVDLINPSDLNMANHETLLYCDGINPKYWERLSPHTASRKKSSFNRLLNKYGLVSTRDDILSSFDQSFDSMITEEQYREECTYSPVYIV